MVAALVVAWTVPAGSAAAHKRCLPACRLLSLAPSPPRSGGRRGRWHVPKSALVQGARFAVPRSRPAAVAGGEGGGEAEADWLETTRRVQVLVSRGQPADTLPEWASEWGPLEVRAEAGSDDWADPAACEEEAEVLEAARAYQHAIRLYLADALHRVALARAEFIRDKVNPSMDRAIRGEGGGIDILENVPGEASSLDSREERLRYVDCVVGQAAEETVARFYGGCSARWVGLGVGEKIEMRAGMRQREAGREQEAFELREAQLWEKKRASFLPGITTRVIKARFWMHEAVLSSVLPDASEAEALAVWAAVLVVGGAAGGQLVSALWALLASESPLNP